MTTNAGRPGNTTPTDSRSHGATGQVEGATRYQTGLKAHMRGGLPTAWVPRCPCSGEPLLRHRRQRPLFHNRYQSDQLSLPSRWPPDPSTPTTMNNPNNNNPDRPLDTRIHLRPRPVPAPKREGCLVARRLRRCGFLEDVPRQSRGRLRAARARGRAAHPMAPRALLDRSTARGEDARARAAE